MVLQSLWDVVSAIWNVAWMMIVGIIFLIIILFWNRIVSAWNNLTEKVLYWITWTHIQKQLPEDLTGPRGKRGGGKQTLQLGEGERLEVVLIPPPASIWLQRQPVSNPKRRNAEGKPVKGAPPLLYWVFILPVLAEGILLSIWAIVSLFGNDMPVIPSFGWFVVAFCLGLILFVPMYWMYEWNRRHYRLVVTTLMAYVISFRAITREYHRSPSPMELVEEVILDSTYSQQTGFLGRLFGGWLQEARDVGNLFMGSRVQEAADFMTFFPSVSALGEIFKAINSLAKTREATRKAALQMAQDLKLSGHAEEARGGLALSGRMSEVAAALQKADAVLNAWRQENPSGAMLNLVDPRILDFTRWDLNTGEPLPEQGV